MEKNHIGLLNHSLTQLIWCPGNRSPCTSEYEDGGVQNYNNTPVSLFISSIYYSNYKDRNEDSYEGKKYGSTIFSPNPKWSCVTFLKRLWRQQFSHNYVPILRTVSVHHPFVLFLRTVVCSCWALFMTHNFWYWVSLGAIGIVQQYKVAQ